MMDKNRGAVSQAPSTSELHHIQHELQAALNKLIKHGGGGGFGHEISRQGTPVQLETLHETQVAFHGHCAGPPAFGPSGGGKPMTNGYMTHKCPEDSKELETQISDLRTTLERKEVRTNLIVADRHFLQQLLTERDHMLLDWASVIEAVDQKQG